MKTFTKDLTSRGLEIKSVTLRVVNSDDTLEAAARCVPADNGDVNAVLFGVMHRQQMVYQSIIEVDGKKVDSPYLPASKWGTRTYEFVREIFDFLNGISGDDREAFRKELAGGSAPASTPAT